MYEEFFGVGNYGNVLLNLPPRCCAYFYVSIPYRG